MTDNAAFRRGAHSAVQAIVDDFSGLVQRRMAAHSPELVTQTIVAMAKRIAERPYPTEDPGPADPLTPDRPAEARPDTATLLAVAALAAEETGENIRITVTSDGVLVTGRRAGMMTDRLRAVPWHEITTGSTPVVSLAVAAIAEELRGG